MNFGTRQRRRLTISRTAAAIVGLVAACVAVLASAGGLAAAATGRAADTPAGFWSGTDSNYIPIPGPAPYRMPAIGGSYGGYIGMIGNWAAWQHCGGKVVWSETNASDARTNLVSLSPRHRHWRVLVHGGPWRGSALQRHQQGSSGVGPGTGSGCAAGTERAAPQADLPGGLPGRGAAWSRAELHACRRQRLERRLHLAMQRQGAA